MQKLILTEEEFHSLIEGCVNRVIIEESFKSQTVKNFFQEHGGVNTEYRQFSLGDIKDSQIGYIKEFQSANDAASFLHNLKKPSGNKRSDYDMKYLFHTFVAKDGSALLIGVKRDTVNTGQYWSGEYDKKISDRLWRNGWNYKIRDNRYVDDSDTYYYQSPAKDFGIYNNDDFKKVSSQRKKDNDQLGRKHKEEMLQRMRDYLLNHYPEQWLKLKKRNDVNP